MARQRGELVGRQAELAALTEACRGKDPALVVVRGARGSGRTALLTQLGRELSGTVLAIPFARIDRPDWDLFGAHAVLTAIREQFESLGANPRLAESITAVSRLCTVETYASAWGQSALLTELSRMFARIAAEGPVTVLADDIDVVPMAVLAVAPAHRAGHHVVATCLDETREPDETAQLWALADRTVDLAPLSDEDVDALVRQLANTPVDAGLSRALRVSLGSLYGNPGTVRSAVADLRERDRLVFVKTHLCLRDPAEPVALPAGHPLLAEVDALGETGRHLVVLASSAAGFAVDETPVLAAATGRPASECGAAVDLLVRAGALLSDPQGKLSCPCPALAAAVRERMGPDAVAALHAAVAGQLLAMGDRMAPDPGVLADHVAAAGRALPPSPELAALLQEEAKRVATRDPACAAERQYAALRHADRDSVQTELVRLLFQAGKYDRMAELVDELAASDGLPASTVARAELATAAALASVHLGRPVAAHVRAALGEHEAFGFCDRWFAGEPVTAPELLSVFAGLAASWPTPAVELRRRTMAEFGGPCAIRDLATVFRSMFGPAYRLPDSGPLAAFHRVVTGFREARWPDAVSAARELETCEHADPAMLAIARLLAAEMCVWHGRDRRAVAWLESVERTGRFGVLRGWVECGLHHEAGEFDEALRVGWDAYTQRESGEPGQHRLLVRLAIIAVEAGRTRWAHQALREAEARHTREDSAVSQETVSLVRGLVERDGAAAEAGERLVRARGHLPDLAWACLVAGQVAEEPDPWLHEAYRLARELGATRLRAKVKQHMEGRGVLAPVARSRRAELSEVELAIVELIRQGRTNRQIALKLRMSEKTVENHLTRLFLKAGCRTRHGLAAASLQGRLEAVGA
ncbi:AAA family ATPase [Amycolatopsis sacchari]|uniref:AAA family ATPase n=1 Tax=Amycolatopsis sacchari TaxID=115433 RepID=UPI003D75FEF0